MKLPSRRAMAAVYSDSGIEPGDITLMIKIVRRCLHQYPLLRGSCTVEVMREGEAHWNFTTRRCNLLVVYRPPNKTWVHFTSGQWPSDPPPVEWNNLEAALGVLWAIQEHRLTQAQVAHIIQHGTPPT